MLDKIHRAKIDQSDSIFVVNPDGYIGHSTFSEIIYAMYRGKLVEYMVWPEQLAPIILKSYENLLKLQALLNLQYDYLGRCIYNWDTKFDETMLKFVKYYGISMENGGIYRVTSLYHYNEENSYIGKNMQDSTWMHLREDATIILQVK